MEAAPVADDDLLKSTVVATSRVVEGKPFGLARFASYPTQAAWLAREILSTMWAKN